MRDIHPRVKPSLEYHVPNFLLPRLAPGRVPLGYLSDGVATRELSSLREAACALRNVSLTWGYQPVSLAEQAVYQISGLSKRLFVKASRALTSQVSTGG